MKKGSYYQIVREMIQEQIRSGVLRPGDKLYSERRLCSDLSLNRNTVRHGLLMLQREGEIFCLERKGWYVSPVRLVYNPAQHVNFAMLAGSQGMQARWTTEDYGEVVVGESVDFDGDEGFPEGASVYKMGNTFFLNEQKVAYTICYLLADRLPDIVPKTVDHAMTQVIEEEYGITLVQRNLLIRPLLLPKKVTSVLGISHGSPGVYVRRTKTDGTDCVLTVEHEYWRFDAIELRVDTKISVREGAPE